MGAFGGLSLDGCEPLLALLLTREDEISLMLLLLLPSIFWGGILLTPLLADIVFFLSLSLFLVRPERTDFVSSEAITCLHFCL